MGSGPFVYIGRASGMHRSVFFPRPLIAPEGSRLFLGVLYKHIYPFHPGASILPPFHRWWQRLLHCLCSSCFLLSCSILPGPWCPAPSRPLCVPIVHGSRRFFLSRRVGRVVPRPEQIRGHSLLAVTSGEEGFDLLPKGGPPGPGGIQSGSLLPRTVAGGGSHLQRLLSSRHPR